MYELPDSKKRIIVLDTEVSGKTEIDQIIELCAFEMVNGKLRPKNKFHSFFKPKNHMSKFLIKRHKIPKKAFFYEKDEEKQFLSNFLSFVKDSIIVTHNAKFDMEMINKALKYHDLPPLPSSQFRCSMRIFLEKYDSIMSKFSKLKECCDFFNVRYSNRRLHLASYDAFILGKMMEKIYKDQNEKEKKIEEIKEEKILNEFFDDLKKEESNDNLNDDELKKFLNDIKEEKEEESKDKLNGENIEDVIDLLLEEGEEQKENNCVRYGS